MKRKPTELEKTVQMTYLMRLGSRIYKELFYNSNKDNTIF